MHELNYELKPQGIRRQRLAMAALAFLLFFFIRTGFDLFLVPRVVSVPPTRAFFISIVRAVALALPFVIGVGAWLLTSIFRPDDHPPRRLRLVTLLLFGFWIVCFDLRALEILRQWAYQNLNFAAAYDCLPLAIAGGYWLGILLWMRALAKRVNAGWIFWMSACALGCQILANLFFMAESIEYARNPLTITPAMTPAEMMDAITRSHTPLRQLMDKMHEGLNPIHIGMQILFWTIMLVWAAKRERPTSEAATPIIPDA